MVQLRDLLLRRHVATLSIVIASATCVHASTGFTQDCVDYGDYIREVGAIAAPRGTAYEVIVRGDYVYVEQGTALWIVDISVPESPVGVAYFAGGSGSGLALQGDFAYVARKDSTLVVVNVSDVTSPVVVSNLYLGAAAYDVEVSESFAYVAARNRFYVVDVSDPSAPVLVGSFADVDPYTDVSVQGNYAYVVHTANSWLSGLTVFDVSDPLQPTRIAVLHTPTDARDVVVSGDYAYVADDRRGMEVVDISNPASPTIVAELRYKGEIKGICMDGDLVYLAVWGSGVQVIDVSDPLDPRHVSSVAQPLAYDVGVDGDRACVGLGLTPGLSVIDVSNPESPPVVSTVAEEYYSPLSVVHQDGRAYLTTTRDNYQCVADWSYLRIVDLTDPRQPAVLGSVRIGGRAFDVAIAGGLAFVARGCRGFLTVDVSDPTSPFTLGRISAYDSTVAVDVHGDHAYVANIEYDWYWEDLLGSLLVIDVSAPRWPSLVGELETGNELVLDLVVREDVAFLAGSFGLKSVDITAPEDPVVVGELRTHVSALGLDIEGNHAFLACGRGGLIIVDVSDVSAPLAVGSLGFGADQVRDVDVEDGVAYLARDTYGIHVVDVSDPYHPVYVGGRDTPGRPRDVAVGSCVLVADEYSNLLIMPRNCATVPSPVQLSHFMADREAGGDVLVSWSLGGSPAPAALRLFYAFEGESVRQPSGGIELPVIASRYVHQDAPMGGVLYFLEVTERDGERTTYGPVRARAVSSPVAFWVSTVYPNPSHDLAAVDVGLPTAGTVRWTVSDIVGRKVASRDYGRLNAGVHRLEWDGRFLDGSRAPRGVYFYRLEAAGQVRTGKLVLRPLH